jgi:hypothetical protein
VAGNLTNEDKMTAKPGSKPKDTSRTQNQGTNVNLFDPFERIFRHRSWIDSYAGFAEVSDFSAFSDAGRELKERK